MTLGLVILNYNDAEETLGLVQAIKGYPAIEHILVVDNQSTDDSWDRLSGQLNDTWELIRSGENRGYAYGNNVGIRYLAKKYNVDIIGISNPDVEFDNEFIEEIKADFEKNPDYAILSGVQHRTNGEVHWHSFWKKYNTKDCYVDIMKSYPLFGRFARKRHRLEAYVPEQLAGKTEVFPVGVVGGCLFFARTDDMMQAGCFDENTFLYFEEDILSRRMEKLQKKVGVDPELHFIHKGSESIDKTLTQKKKARQMLQSQKYFFKTYVSKNKLALFWRDLLAEIHLLLLTLLAPLLRWWQRRNALKQALVNGTKHQQNKSKGAEDTNE